jgi:uncharacterized protein YeaO (DUF488 family)
MAIQVKRVYEHASKRDGVRVLVDRVWPRGLTKDKAHIDKWAKDIAPSTELRKWFGHDPSKWKQFKQRYFKELSDNKTVLESLFEEVNGKTITLVFGAKQTEYNNATALKEYMEKHGFH